MAGIDITPDAQGKVRDLYDLGDRLLLVATDRISAFDYILEDEIPYKGQVLTQLSKFWFDLLDGVVENHLISTDVADLPEEFQPYADYLRGRFMLVKKADMFPAECIVRGYLAGSGLKEYNQRGHRLRHQSCPRASSNSSKLPEPIFAPSTKAEIGDHDENITFERLDGNPRRGGCHGPARLGVEGVHRRRRPRGRARASSSPTRSSSSAIVVCTGASSWPTRYSPPTPRASGPAIPTRRARCQPSFDKQFVRDWLTAHWDKTGNPPRLPQEIIDATSAKYIQAYETITGKKFDPATF